jgi:hypothetical protein
MKFNREQGAIVADEITWHLGFKYGYLPTRYGDSISNLLTEDYEKKNDFVCLYAGVGFPCLHEEVVRKSRNSILKDPECINDLDKAGEIVHNHFQETTSRYINDRLRFLMGFDRDEFNKGKFLCEGKEYEIKQEAVVNEVRKIIKNQDKSDTYKRIFNNDAVMMGYDKEHGMRAYSITNSGKDMEFAYPFGGIGTGQEIGTKMFSDVFYRMQLEERRKGFNFSDGLFLLMNCFVESGDFDNKSGGYTQIMLVDASRKVFGKSTKEINDHNAHLATEVIRAYRWGFISRETAQSMTDKLITEQENWKQIETELFDTASDPELLRKYLMGYKPASVPAAPLV